MTAQLVMKNPGILQPNPLNPRGPTTDAEVMELAQSIKEKGVLQPLTILPDDTIVIGHRRQRAAIVAGLNQVPCIVREMSEREQLDTMLIENIQREDLNPLQEGMAYLNYLAQGDIIQDLARRMGVPAARIHNRVKIARFPEDVCEMFAKLELPISAADPLAKIEDTDMLRRYAGMIVARTLTVPALEKLVKQNAPSTRRPQRNYEHKNSERPKGPVRDVLVRALSDRSEEQLTVADMLREMDYVCCACGMAKDELGQETLCAACPLAAFLNRFARVLGEDKNSGELRVAKDIKGAVRNAG